MTVLPSFNQFRGIHWDTGPIRNALEYQGVTAPHTGRPLSEELLFGISGGLVAGYMVFEYQGFMPNLHFLTRNTFDPMEHLVRRLGVSTAVKHASEPGPGVANLRAALSAGQPALVWADMAGMPYSDLPERSDMCQMIPMLVYGFDEAADAVFISDRASVPLRVTTWQLKEARSRVKRERQRVMTVRLANLDRLALAVEEGIAACISMFEDEPPRQPLKGKFGYDAFMRWAHLLTNSQDSQSWARQFPPGPRLYAGLTSAYQSIHLWWTGGNGARGVYAAFLAEAAAILGKPALTEAAARYRVLEGMWGEFGRALLPDQISPLRDAREMMQRRYNLFVEQGGASVAQRHELTRRLMALEQEMGTNFPLDEGQATAMRELLAEQLHAICAQERRAIATLREAMA